MAIGKLNEKAVKELDNFINEVSDKLTGKNKDPVVKAIDTWIKKVKQNLIDNDLRASERLLQSIATDEIRYTGSAIQIDISIEDYWKEVEEGTKPKGFTKENLKKLQPKIRLWISEKPTLQAIAGDKANQRSLSYAIATNILKKGTIKRFGYKGKKFITSEIPYLQELIIKAFEQ